jgi:predicted nucleic acid-binding protein
VTAFVDTSVLVAAFYADHEHRAESFDLLQRHKRRELSCAAHSLADFDATVTTMPGVKRVSPAEAVLHLGDLAQRLTPVPVSAAEYLNAAGLAAASGAASGDIFDALIGTAFEKSKAKCFYTWNLRQFQRLSGKIGDRVRIPSLK